MFHAEGTIKGKSEYAVHSKNLRSEKEIQGENCLLNMKKQGMVLTNLQRERHWWMV